MGSYLIRRILLIFPTLFGIMLINFAVIQIVPGGPVEQMIAQMTGTAVESTARFSGAGEGELNSSLVFAIMLCEKIKRNIEIEVIKVFIILV